MTRGRGTWLEIDLDAIESNVEAIKSNMTEGNAFCAIVKNDAYAHGARVVAKTLDGNDAVDYFGVACYDEARDVRAGGAKKPVLILGYTDPSYAPAMAEQGIEGCCFSSRYAKKLNDAMEGSGRKLRVHMKIDTGMSRLGIVNQTPEDFEPAMAEAIEMLSMPNLDFVGIFTHFAKAEDEDAGFTDYQYANFLKMVCALEDAGHRFKYIHCNNSAGGAFHPDKQCTMARSGTALYGYTPNPRRPIPGVRRAIQWKAVIAQIKTLRAGAVISYGCEYTVPSTSVIATIPVGYADGLFREMSGDFDVLVHGKRARSVGRVCMDQFMIDITGIDGVEEGDTVTLFGDDWGSHLDAMEMCKKLNKTQINLITYIGRRVPRVYFKAGQEVAEDNFLMRV